MIRALPRYRQLNLVSIALLGTMAAIATLQVLDPTHVGRLLAHVAILVCVSAAVVYGVRHAGRKPTWLLPRMALACFTLGCFASLVAGNYLPATTGAIMAVIAPMLLTDERWNRLFRFRFEAL
ncbi:hypothetical protein CH272_17505 [Rhodococcus sp. 05-340-1]|nr:hypothetical protein CH271_23115 [Rhodococcus sp. 05-340-2]OZD75556.1 hypothetical protein CH272_17505 [Rhodococcus sp. 05-340-1]